MSKLDILMEAFPDEEFLKADGFDDAIIGCDHSSLKLIYSMSKCIKNLMEQDMEFDDALDYFYYNISGSYIGEKSPIWCYDIDFQIG